jgi:NAD(P)-dependent dehydrogenase (short-subunit alcohol dehydrogenase family)
MKVLVLGATGGTGRLIVRDALAKGHSVASADDGIAAVQDANEGTLVTGIALDYVCSREIDLMRISPVLPPSGPHEWHQR